MALQFGTFVPQGWIMDLVEIDDPIAQYEAMTAVAQAAESAGYDSIWVFDHFHTVPTPEIETCFEAWTITSALARDTKTIKIGQMVTCNGYRNPALLAKIASTVDVLSHGRLLCGLGAGWYEHEWRAYGYGFPELRDRMRAFREAVELIVKMWTEEKASYQGEYYTLDGAINEPKGVQKPHIPLWLGGGGETITLKLVAQWGNASNFGDGKLDVCAQKLGVLRQHCADLGRDFDTITRSTNMNLVLLNEGDDPVEVSVPYRQNVSYEDFREACLMLTPDACADHIRELEKIGINYVIVYFPRVAYDHSQMQLFAEQVIPQFK